MDLDADNREPPPRGGSALPVPSPFMPTEDDLDASTRAGLDRWERDDGREGLP